MDEVDELVRQGQALTGRSRTTPLWDPERDGRFVDDWDKALDRLADPPAPTVA
ncbi:MAG: hypothetical protein WD250_02545 [Egibacteraceae bacterium]